MSELPKEPIPGNSYRTKDNACVSYIGKTKKGVYVYEDTDGDMLEYARPFQYWLSDDDDNEGYDIIAPWTEPLPAVEIKRWVATYIHDNGMAWKRGDKIPFQDDFLSLQSANNWFKKQGNPEEIEIVELTGTLPAREQT
jgi:hypothetical protein